MRDVIFFLLGGYLVPSLHGAVLIILAEIDRGELRPIEIAASAVVGGLLWPFMPHDVEPMN